MFTCSCVGMLLLYFKKQRWYKISYRDMSLNIDCHCLNVHAFYVTSCKLCVGDLSLLHSILLLLTIENDFFFAFDSSIFIWWMSSFWFMPLFYHRSLSAILFFQLACQMLPYENIIEIFSNGCRRLIFCHFLLCVSAAFEWPTGK